MFRSIKNFFVRKKTKLSTLNYRDCGSLFFSKIAIHTGEGKFALPHIKLWDSVFKKIKYDYCIITRIRSAFEELQQYYTNTNIVYAKSPRDLENILNNLNLKIIFYTSNTGNNLHMCKFDEYRHIFIGHGDSNKSSSARNVFRIYNEVWCSGQAQIDRFKHANIDMSGTQLKIIGQPFLDDIHNTIPSRNSFLYMPTWEGIYKEQAYSSLPIAKELFCNSKIMDKLAIKMHPATGTNNRLYRKMASSLIESLQSYGIRTQLYPENIDVHHIMPEHGGYICDISAVVTSALFFNRPLFIYTPQGLNYADTDINFQDFAYTFSDTEEFITRMLEYHEHGDTFAKKREEISDYFISRKAMAKGNFKNFIDEIINY